MYFCIKYIYIHFETYQMMGSKNHQLGCTHPICSRCFMISLHALHNEFKLLSLVFLSFCILVFVNHQNSSNNILSSLIYRKFVQESLGNSLQKITEWFYLCKINATIFPYPNVDEKYKCMLASAFLSSKLFSL